MNEVSRELPDRFYGGYYGYGGSYHAPSPSLVTQPTPFGQFVAMSTKRAEQQKEKESMSSKVKVKVERTKLITLLEERLTTLDAEPLHPIAQKLADAMEAAAAHVREGGRVENNDGYATEPLKVVFDLNRELARHEHNDRGPSPQRLRDKINRQLKLLNLSDDEHIEVGIEDEIYELL